MCEGNIKGISVNSQQWTSKSIFYNFPCCGGEVQCDLCVYLFCTNLVTLHTKPPFAILYKKPVVIISSSVWLQRSKEAMHLLYCDEYILAFLYYSWLRASFLGHRNLNFLPQSVSYKVCLTFCLAQSSPGRNDVTCCLAVLRQLKKRSVLCLGGRKKPR